MSYDELALRLVYKIKETLVYESDEHKVITISEPQEHKVQKFFRRLGFKIPTHKKIALDEYASFVFGQIDGIKTVSEIGQLLNQHYGEAANPLYERLLVFLNHLEQNCGYIERV